MLGFFNSSTCYLYFIQLLSIIYRYIRRGQPDAGFALFESESLKWPGFVEFDDVNGKVLTYSAQDRYIFICHVLLFKYTIVNSIWTLTHFAFGFWSWASIYKVFDLKNYTMLYSISDKNVQEIKIRYLSPTSKCLF